MFSHMAAWPKSIQLMAYMKPNVLQNQRKAFRPLHTPRHVGPMRALSSQNDFFIQSLTREMYVHNKYQLRCEIVARVISRAAPIEANCSALSPACCEFSAPASSIFTKCTSQTHLWPSDALCVVCVCARLVIAASHDAPNK